GPRIIQRNVPLPVIQAFVDAASQFVDATGAPGGVDLSTVTVIVDQRSKNLSEVSTNGIDLGISYAADTAFGDLEAGIDGTYILEFDNRFVPTAPTVQVLNI